MTRASKIKDVTAAIQNHDWSLEGKQLINAGKFAVDHFFTLGLLGLKDALALDRRIENLEKTLLSNNENLKEIDQSAIRQDYIKSEEFREVMISSFVEASEIRNRNKINYFKSAILSSAIRTDINKIKKLLFISCLSNLSEDSIELLAGIYKLRIGGRLQQSHINVGTLLSELGTHDSEVTIALLRELERFNLLFFSWSTGVGDQESGLIFFKGLLHEFCQFITEYSGKPIVETS